jgi:hypothetical protein
MSKWKVLRNWVKSSGQEEPPSGSSFNLIFPSINLVKIAAPSFSDLNTPGSQYAGFLNTGVAKACWETERVLAHYLISLPKEQLAGRILELGSGSVGLAGLLVAVTHHPSLVVITDGSGVQL